MRGGTGKIVSSLLFFPRFSPLFIHLLISFFHSFLIASFSRSILLYFCLFSFPPFPFLSLLFVFVCVSFHLTFFTRFPLSSFSFLLHLFLLVPLYLSSPLISMSFPLLHPLFLFYLLFHLFFSVFISSSIQLFISFCLSGIYSSLIFFPSPLCVHPSIHSLLSFFL